MRAMAMVMVLVSGCSFLVTGPPAAAPAPPDCVRSVFPPILDIGIGFFALVGTEISAGGGSLGERSDSGLEVFIPALAAATASSIYGFVRTSQCRNAYEDRAAAPTYAPPPPPSGGPGAYPPAPPPPAPFTPPAQ
jgi:hypothetical protein